MKLNEYRVEYTTTVDNVNDNGVVRIVRNNGCIMVEAKTINDALDVADSYLKSHFNESYRIGSLIQQREWECEF